VVSRAEPPDWKLNREFPDDVESGLSRQIAPVAEKVGILQSGKNRVSPKARCSDFLTDVRRGDRRAVIGPVRTGSVRGPSGVESKKQNLVKMFGKLLTSDPLLLFHIYR